MYWVLVLFMKTYQWSAIQIFQFSMDAGAHSLPRVWNTRLVFMGAAAEATTIRNSLASPKDTLMVVNGRTIGAAQVTIKNLFGWRQTIRPSDCQQDADGTLLLRAHREAVAADGWAYCSEWGRN